MNELMKYIPEPAPMPELPEPGPSRSFRPSSGKALFFGACAACLALFFLYSIFISAPKSFPAGSALRIEQGKTLSETAMLLAEADVISSPRVFKALVRAFAPNTGAKAGDYEMDRPQNVVVMAWRISRGSYDLTLEKVTIPEGLNSSEIAAIFSKDPKFSSFDAEAFKKQAAQREGYLFPDTYFFLPNVTASQAIDVMTATYSRRIAAATADIRAFGKPEKDAITMASIIEREASSDQSERSVISGILWKRLAEGMPLQVDAAPETYREQGLPKAPIGNPGLATIEAAVKPTATPYYYYLHGKDGKIRYATTLAQHITNQALYLR